MCRTIVRHDIPARHEKLVRECDRTTIPPFGSCGAGYLIFLRPHRPGARQYFAQQNLGEIFQASVVSGESKKPQISGLLAAQSVFASWRMAERRNQPLFLKCFLLIFIRVLSIHLSKNQSRGPQTPAVDNRRRRRYSLQEHPVTNPGYSPTARIGPISGLR